MIEKKFEDYITAENQKFTGVCLINNNDDDDDCYNGVLKRKIWMKNGLWHRLDGPASIDTCNISGGERKTECKFWINDKQIKEEIDYWKHPLVVKAKLNKILEL